MNASIISTPSLWNSSRGAAPKLQAGLAKANEEIATGRHADIGLALGTRTGDAINLRRERLEIDSFRESNALIGSRLELAQGSVRNMRQAGESFLNVLVAMPTTRDGAAIAADAQEKLKSLILELNQSSAGQYLFAGANTKEKPVEAYVRDDGADSVARTALAGAFSSHFGFAPSDPAVGTIAPADLKSFLDDVLEPFFLSDANWKANWSSASSDDLSAWISPAEQVETSANANETAVRKAAMAYTIVLDLGIDAMRAETREVLLGKAIGLLGSSNDGLMRIEERFGVTGKRVSDASDRLDTQKYVYDTAIGELESVDPAEAKTRVDMLMTQLQMSYYLTSQLRSVSLLNYL